MRNVVFYVAGVRYEAPEAWMMGAHFQRVRSGMDCKEAMLDAMNYWAQQAQMAAEFEAQNQ